MLTIEDIARVCHEVNRAYCVGLGDHSQVVWEEAPDWQRESTIKGVEFRLAHPFAPPSAQHEKWLKTKREEGWSYGPVKNVQTKEHPCFLPYNELPSYQKVKDYLFGGVVDALAGKLGAVAC